MRTTYRVGRLECLAGGAAVLALAAVGLSALSAAGGRARDVVCVANMAALQRAWHLYHADSDGLIPGGMIRWNAIGDGFAAGEVSAGSGDPEYPKLWAWPPVTGDLQYVGRRIDLASLDDRVRGCQRGALYPYIGSGVVYHCPADGAYRAQPPWNRYRSYSLSGNMAVRDIDRSIRWFHQIRQPAMRYVFVEEGYDGLAANYNHGCWDFEPWQNEWHDPLALFHRRGGAPANVTNFSFADGHVEQRIWRCEETVMYFIDRYSIPPHPVCNEDWRWAADHYIDPEWNQED